jgi:predicted metal-dependent hydrolase
MTRAITVRNLSFALSEKTPRYWYEGHPGKTHVMNALSSIFPEGEAFFVRSVQHYRDRVDDPKLQAEIRAFAGQEGVHSREHDRHVQLLVEQGYPMVLKMNELEATATRALNRRLPPFALAVTAALEHLTAILARRSLAEPHYWMTAMHEDMAPMWQWHAMEESEHKAVAFDVLQIVSGSYWLRVLAMFDATFGLLTATFVRWGYFMYRDGLLTDRRQWVDTFRFLWNRDGLFRRLIPDYLSWFRRDFHPGERDDWPLIDACRSRLAALLA